MAVVWESFAQAQALNGGDPVVTKPSGTVSGNLLMAGVFSTDAAVVITPPSGWAAAFTLTSGRQLFYKVAGGSEPADYTWGISGATAATIVTIVRLSGADTSNPFDGAGNGVAIVSGTGIVIPAVSPSGNGRYLFQWVCKTTTGMSFTKPASATERHDAQTANCASASGDETVNSGSTGTRTWTASGSAGQAGGFMIAVVPAPGAGTFTGGYDFTGSAFTGEAGPGEGSFSGGYDFTGSSFAGEAGPSEGAFTGNVDWSSTGFEGSAPGVSSGSFTGTYDFSSTGFTGAGGDADNLIDVYGTEGGRRRFGGRK